MASPPFVGAEAIAEVGSLAGLIEAMERGLRGRPAEVPERTLIRRGEPARVFGAMPALGEGLFITKVAAMVPDLRPAVSALVVALDARTGRPLAVLEGRALTALKCAAVSALVIDRCARPEARVLGLVGTGAQADQQVAAARHVRPIEQIRVHSRDPRNVRAFLDRHRDAAALIPCGSVEEALDGADVIATATTSSEPLFDEQLPLAPEVHINCMGAHTSRSRELPPELLRRAWLIVEDRPTAIAEAGALHREASTLAELLERPPPPGHLTVFSSTGHASLDLLTTAHILGALGISS